jgi:hypothetical protein
MGGSMSDDANSQRTRFRRVELWSLVALVIGGEIIGIGGAFAATRASNTETVQDLRHRGHGAPTQALPGRHSIRYRYLHVACMQKCTQSGALCAFETELCNGAGGNPNIATRAVLLSLCDWNLRRRSP